MLDYARQRAITVLKNPHKAIFVTSGPAGVQASEHPCETIGLQLYLLLPGTSDHLFNLEQDRRVTLLATGWKLRGEASILPVDKAGHQLELLVEPEAEWCVLVRVNPSQINICTGTGWGNLETIDLESL